jgi:hypothetical protein
MRRRGIEKHGKEEQRGDVWRGGGVGGIRVVSCTFRKGLLGLLAVPSGRGRVGYGDPVRAGC